MAKQPRKKKVAKPVSKSAPQPFVNTGYVESYDVKPTYRKKLGKIKAAAGSTKRGDVVHCSINDAVFVVVDDLSEMVYAQPVGSEGNDQMFLYKKHLKFKGA